MSVKRIKHLENSTGKRIKELMAIRGLTQETLASKIGVSRGAISQWINGMTSPKGTNLIKVSEALRTTPEYLLGQEDDLRVNDDTQPSITEIGELELWDSYTAVHDEDVELPFYSEVELSAGSGRTAVREDARYKLRFSKNTLRKNGIAASNAVCAKVSGSSMEPILPNGSTIGIDTGCKRIIDGKIYAIESEGLLRVKQLFRKTSGDIVIRSFNISDYPDESYSQTEFAQHCRIIGRVFWWSVIDR